MAYRSEFCTALKKETERNDPKGAATLAVLVDRSAKGDDQLKSSAIKR